MAKVTEIPEGCGITHVCKTCEVEFVIPEGETAVCCPICRMNRIRPVE